MDRSLLGATKVSVAVYVAHFQVTSSRQRVAMPLSVLCLAQSSKVADHGIDVSKHDEVPDAMTQIIQSMPPESTTCISLD